MRSEVIIIGGGIYGTAVCYFLSHCGIRVVLVEEEAIGAGGATAFSRGIVRVYDPDPVLAGLSFAGRHELSNWEQLGYPGLSPFRRTGCLYRVARDNQKGAIQLIRELRENGYSCELYAFRELKAGFPFIEPGVDDLAIWEPDSGYGDPRLASVNLAVAGKMQGALVYERCRAIALDRHRDRWEVRLPYGSIDAQILFIAAGAASRSLLEGLPVSTRSIGLLYMNGGEELRPAVPVIDEITATYIRPLENGGYYCGTQISSQADVPGDLPAFGQLHLDDAAFRMRQLLLEPYVGKPVNGLMGFDAYTPDHRPLVGFMNGYEDLYVATGFSGRGFKYALALSKQIAFEIGSRLGHSMGGIQQLSNMPAYA